MKQAGYRYKESINESQESESIKAARKLYMQRRGVDENEADRWVRIDLRGDIPALRSKQGGKFIFGITRMFLDGQIRDAATIENINTSVQYASTDAHIKEYDRNLNGLSAQEFINKFADAVKADSQADRNARAQEQYIGESDYQIIPINSFEEAQQYSKYTSWCITHYENMYESYSSNGVAQFYFCLKKGFENVRMSAGENCPLDEYGLSMIAVCVDKDGRLKTCTCRWNHDKGGNDHILDTKQISQIVNRNFYEVFKPNEKWASAFAQMKEFLKTGKELHQIFEFVSSPSCGITKVKFGKQWSYINENREFITDTWFDLGTDFCHGIAGVQIENRWNFIDVNGQYISQEWFANIKWDGGFDIETHKPVNWIAVQKMGDHSWYFMNYQGEMMSEQGWEEIDSFYEGWARVKWKSQFNYINANNELLSDEWFVEANPFRKGFACVYSVKGGWNFLSKIGYLLLPERYADYIKNFNSDGYALVRHDMKWGVISNECEVVVEPQYRNIDGENQGVARVEDFNGWNNYIYIPTGELLLDRWVSQGRLPRLENGGIYAEVYYDNEDTYPENVLLKQLTGGYKNRLERLIMRRRDIGENKTIIISERQAQILKESLLKEGISPIIYHFTSLQALYQILMSQKFYLKTGVFRDSYEHKLSDGKRMYYLSTTRNRNANEGYSNAYKSEGGVRITLDGEKLSHNYKGKPTNYWGDDSALGRMKYLNPDKVGQPLKWDNEMQQHRNDETEDRIWSFHPTIPNALEYIKRIDILLPDENKISDYETRIEKAKQDGKDALVKSFQNSIENRKGEERSLKSVIYDIYNIIGKRGILFLYDNEKDFSMGNNNVVTPEWLTTNDFYTDYKERQATYSTNSNYSTNIGLFQMLSSALAIMVFNEKRENRKKRIVEYCKKYGFQNMLNGNLINQVDSILFRSSNIYDISRYIDDNMRSNKEDSAKVQDMLTHWMRKNGYRSLRNVVGEGKEITKVRQGMIAYEEIEPDYEIGFEEGDISPYAHVITESPDNIETTNQDFDDVGACPFIMYKGFPEEVFIGPAGTTHDTLINYIYEEVAEASDDLYKISDELRNAFLTKKLGVALRYSFELEGRYWNNEWGQMISVWEYDTKNYKDLGRKLNYVIKQLEKEGWGVDVNTLDFDDWKGSQASRFPFKWLLNDMADIYMENATRINKKDDNYVMYCKNGNVLTINREGFVIDNEFEKYKMAEGKKQKTIVISESQAKQLQRYLMEETNPEDVDLSSFKIKKKLNPKFWKNNKLDSRVRLKLLDIADDFVDSLNINWTEPSDITMTGSLANYTWNEKYSDIDLHIIMDYKKVDKRVDFVKNYFDSKKKEWNEKHKDIKIYGFPVEVYVQDEKETHKSSGVYSLETNEWITEPDADNFSDDDYNHDAVKKVVADYMNQIDDIESKFNKVEDLHQTEQIYDEADEIFDNIKDERKNAFKTADKELSDGNVIFKTLRRNGYIEKISNLKDKTYDKLNSLS